MVNIGGNLKWVVVGVDPGTRSGVAVIDIGSSDVWVASGVLKRSDISKIILQHGMPVLVATDKKTPSDSVRKISASLGARIWRPKSDMSVKEKTDIVKGFDLRSSHERDALAAAIVCHRKVRKMMEKISARMKRRRIYADAAEVLAIVIKNKMSVATALKEMSK